MDKVKDIYNETFIDLLTKAIKTEYAIFDSIKCHELIFQTDWDGLAFKQRMRRITVSLFETLPKDYKEALAILYKVAPQFNGLRGIIFPDYVEQYGLTNWNESMQALETFTIFSTSEFAVRPFLLRDQENMMAQLLKWSLHNNEHIRRLASEGSRPRLPWGLSIPSFKLDPYPILPILHNLKEDDSLYVRKSVANNLNDISKTHPDLVLDITTKWYGENQYTDWILKHACRTLLKNGDKLALAIFGYKDGDSLQIMDFACNTNRIAIGDNINFSFKVRSSKNIKLRIEYAIDYVKARNNRSRKVFKITETKILEGETKSYTKKHSFKDLSTRKHYKGVHTISIIVNGITKTSFDFIVE
jgi:3-methyladenine DNA glycosylase AlkC